MKIVAIIGSIGKDSVNRKLAESIKKNNTTEAEIEFLTLEEFPMFSVDIEADAPQAIIDALDTIRSADAVMFFTPEYNFSIPGVLKNALDWFSRIDEVLKDKPALILGATIGRFGTIRAQLHLREVLEVPNLGAKLMPHSELCIAGINDLTDDEGYLTDERTIKFLDRKLNDFVEWVKEVK